MKLMTAVVALLLGVFCAGASYASGDGFVETSDAIIEQLTEPRDFGATRSFVNSEDSERTRTITVRLKSDGEKQDKDVQVGDEGAAGVARLKVEFDVNSARLRPGSYEILDNLGMALADVRVAGRQVCIKGHTDSDGSDGYNLGLSYDRAEAVRDYVIARHELTGADLFVVGYGEQMPLAKNSTPENKQVNRRVEITLGCPEVR